MWKYSTFSLSDEQHIEIEKEIAKFEKKIFKKLSKLEKENALVGKDDTKGRNYIFSATTMPTKGEVLQWKK